ncbi:protein kinase domain-containing protein [Haliangium ochraceum]|uniref:Adenylate/guanylate cyclase n=1 Tax=Haliangium ochraceum (strain DSM 14365 / JCM 11303 / SMP-2) TaxID=502025 RepID=D0LR84_HALO1|nr:protein kinase [Haliangium ochraceum]ACY17112.1 adenylate/guanylate cyclase [Haliangium ochraceum DSM 14365]
MSETVGKYRLQHELGRGGMGVVWEAHDPQLRRQVAVKLLRSSGRSSESLLAQFEREAQAVARLQSPHVVQIYDYGVSEAGHPYMVMEVLRGESLADRLQRTRTLTPAALQPLLAQIAKALDAAHEAGIVHRDLKPGNIFLTRHGADEVVKILDFGVASVYDAPADVTLRDLDETQDIAFATANSAAGGKLSLGLAGTPAYMSPEQARAEDSDRRSDLWALGVIAYEALTGRLPFQGATIPTVLMRICMEEFARPSAVMPALGEAFDGFFLRAMAKLPEQRFSSAQAMVAAFSSAVPERERRGAIKVLVVDDERDLPLLIEQCFQEQIDSGQYRFLFAGNGLEGLGVLRDHPDVDIALTDLRMPGMDGMTFLDQIGEVAPALRAIVISAFGDMRNIRQAMNRGAFDFLNKPLDFDDLEVTMEKAAREAAKLRNALQTMEENEALRMFVSPSVRERLLPVLRVSSGVAGEREELAVASVRILGHRRLVDAPREAVSELNRAYDDLAPILDAHQGAIVHFLGDRILVVFRGEAYQARAAAACLEIRDLLVQRHRGSLAAGPSIGLTCGEVVSGTVGAPSKRRFDFTVFGEPVMLAQELEWMARPGQVLMAEALATELDASFEREPVPALELSDHDGALQRVFQLNGSEQRAARSGTTAKTVSLGDVSFGDVVGDYDNSATISEFGEKPEK